MLISPQPPCNRLPARMLQQLLDGKKGAIRGSFPYIPSAAAVYEKKS